MDFHKLLEFYKGQVYGDLMPYWMRHIDPRYGGVLNCLSNRGDTLLHEHKFVWSQGRWTYQTAQAYEAAKGDVPEATRESYLAASKAAALFLMRHARLPGGNCAFVLSREGKPIRINDDGTARAARDGEGYDYSITADQFAYNGVAEYARVSGDRTAYDWAKDLFLSVEHRRTTGTARQEFPYPWPQGYRTHGDPMGMVLEAHEMARAAAAFGDEAFAARLRALARAATREVMDRFVQPDHIILEALDEHYRPVDTILGNYVNPGHSLEDMWFILHEAMAAGDSSVAPQVAEVTRTTIDRAWDQECGGIPQFIARTGGRPVGPVPRDLRDHPMVRKLQTLWDKKLWWPHSETLYTLLLVYEQTGETWALKEYERFHEYTFRTFPNPDKRVGEWIQIRDRKGEPEESVVALPVKDPMHIIRAFLHAINVLKRMTQR